MFSLERLNSLLDQFPQLCVGLIGDLFLDRYLEIEPGIEELSIETGLEAYQITRVRNQPGALGTVLNNLAALGVGRLAPVTVIGRDGHGFDLLDSLTPLPVTTDYVVQHPDRLTPTYTKPIRRDPSGRVEELNRLDVRDRRPLPVDATDSVLANLDRLAREADGIIVLDQINEPGWGVVNQHVRDALVELRNRSPEKLIFVDSRTQLSEFKCGVLKGNESEFRAMHGLAGELEEALQSVHRMTGCPVYCTLGEDGMLVVADGQPVAKAPGFKANGPVDIVGAGDSASAGIVASLLAGADPVEAAMMGNLAASVTVQKLGTTGTATPEELRQQYHQVAAP